MPGMQLVGLGWGTSKSMTREAWEILLSADEIWMRDRQHPALADMPDSLKIHYIAEETSSADSDLVEDLLMLARGPKGVVYAVPGQPLVGDATCAELIRRAAAEDLPVTVTGGQSIMEAALAAIGPLSSPRISTCEAASLCPVHVPPFPPDAAALITNLSSASVALEVVAVLRVVYPGNHAVKLIHGAGSAQVRFQSLSLDAVAKSDAMGPSTCLYVPPLGDRTSLEALQEVVARLRAPDGCPWDRQQTHQSLRRHLLEEAYEAVAAVDARDISAMREEWGDLLLQIVLNSQIAAESGEFTLGDVIQGISDKIIRRHPHVFGDLKIDGVDGVLANWEKLKELERGEKAKSGGLLDGVPRALPALGQAQEYQERAARVGFDWPELEGVLEKIGEEIREVKEATDSASLTAELGDLMFALVNLARWKGVDAESALREANVRFRKRFGFVESGAKRLNRRLFELTLDEMEALWQEAKGFEA